MARKDAARLLPQLKEYGEEEDEEEEKSGGDSRMVSCRSILQQ